MGGRGSRPPKYECHINEQPPILFITWVNSIFGNSALNGSVEAQDMPCHDFGLRRRQQPAVSYGPRRAWLMDPTQGPYVNLIQREGVNMRMTGRYETRPFQVYIFCSATPKFPVNCKHFLLHETSILKKVGSVPMGHVTCYM